MNFESRSMRQSIEEEMPRAYNARSVHEKGRTDFLGRCNSKNTQKTGHRIYNVFDKNVDVISLKKIFFLCQLIACPMPTTSDHCLDTTRRAFYHFSTFQCTKTSIFFKFDDLGFPLLRHVFLAVYARINIFNWIVGELRWPIQSDTVFPFPFRCLGLLSCWSIQDWFLSFQPMFHRL